MRPDALKYIPAEDVVLFEKIKKIIDNLPDIDLGNDERGEPIVLSCHILARAIAKFFRLKYADGLFHPNFEHSWIYTPSNHIIDVYPVGAIGGPMLHANNTMCPPAYWLFKKISSRKISFGQFGRKSFRRSVNRVYREIRAIAKEHGT